MNQVYLYGWDRAAFEAALAMRLNPFMNQVYLYKAPVAMEDDKAATVLIPL